MEPKQDREEPDFLAILDKIRTTAQAAGVRVGIHTMTGAYTNKMFKRGFNLATIMNDSGLMLTAARAQVAIARG
jgi:4-hydroxy-2-oxoheptanedioate aldolase